jgi:hypothetical protein
MPKYQELEDEFVSAVEQQNIPAKTEAMQKLFETLLRKHQNLTLDEQIHIRLYYNAKGTLKGLSEWRHAI